MCWPGCAHHDSRRQASHSQHSFFRSCPSTTCANTQLAIPLDAHLPRRRGKAQAVESKEAATEAEGKDAGQEEEDSLCLVACEECTSRWCGHCWAPYHANIHDCEEAGQACADWHAFVRSHEELCGPDSAHGKAAAAFKKAQLDEEATARTCKMCPHCKMGPIFRIDGCDSMTCGTDASDKGATRRFEGCGKAFTWPEAPAYEVGSALKAQPAPPEELAAVAEGGHEPLARMCMRCKTLDVQGTCFDCVCCTADTSAFAEEKKKQAEAIFWLEHALDWRAFRESMPSVADEQLKVVFKETVEVRHRARRRWKGGGGRVGGRAARYSAACVRLSDHATLRATGPPALATRPRAAVVLPAPGRGGRAPRQQASSCPGLPSGRGAQTSGQP